MSSLAYMFVCGLVFTVLPFSIAQIEIALNQDGDLERFCLWVCIASVVAGLPFMVTSFQQAPT